MSDMIESMAYAKDTPWHHLGKYLGDMDVDSDTMRKEAGMDFEVKALPIAQVWDPEGQTNRAVAFGKYRALIRTDKMRVLGTCRAVYKPFQNKQIFDFMDSLREDGALKYHTAGVLFSGERVWALCQTEGQFDVRRRNGKTDALKPFLFMTAGHDGGTPIVLAPTSVRVVCWNTLNAALNESRVLSWRIKHTASMDSKLAKARQALLGSQQETAALAKLGTELDREKMDRVEFIRFANTLLLTDNEIESVKDAQLAKDKMIEKLKDLRKEGKETRVENQTEAFLKLFENGAGNAASSRWDALNAVTDFIDHQRERLQKGADSIEKLSRMTESAMRGTGATRKRRALSLLTNW